MAAPGLSTKEGATLSAEPFHRADLSGTSAGPYRLLCRYGSRGVADLYLGRTTDSANSATVKVVDTMYAPAGAVRLFNLERELVDRFKHPNLAKALCEGTTSTGALYLAIEHIEGIPLDEYIRRSSLSGSAAIEIFLQLCSAVEYLHAEGFSHNDLRPESIVVSRANRVAIVDFGATAAISPVPPERHMARSRDIEGLGRLLRDSMQGISWPGLDQVIWKATRPAPADRFRTVSDLAQRLQRLL
jgi:serine/threonine protein kinase